MYKLYSEILASKLIRVCKENNCQSVEQIDFLPGIRGIQKYAFVIESAILEDKKKIYYLLIFWLDFSDAFLFPRK